MLTQFDVERPKSVWEGLVLGSEPRHCMLHLMYRAICQRWLSLLYHSVMQEVRFEHFLKLASLYFTFVSSREKYEKN